VSATLLVAKWLAFREIADHAVVAIELWLRVEVSPTPDDLETSAIR
jgi:hypothetical protein